MGGGGGTSSSGNQFGFQNTTSTYSPDPMAYNYLMSVLQAGSNVGAIPYQPYTGQTLAGFTQDQLAAMQGAREAVGAAQPYIDQATNLAAQAYNLSSPSNFSQAAVQQYANPYMQEAVNNLPVTYSQANVAQYYDPRLQKYLETAPLTYSADAVNQYYNPYQQQVINATQAAIEQQNAQQMQQQQAEAIRSGAFGGDRSGAARAMLAGQQNLSQNQVLGNLRQQGYQNALAAFQQQQQQGLGVAASEAARANAMFQQQQGQGLQARQQQYAQALAQYNQQQQQAIQAAQQAAYSTAQLGTQAQQAKLQGLQALLGTGQLQQQLDQQQLNQNYSNWMAAQSYPYMQTAFMAGLGGLAPGLGGTTNTSGFGYGSSNQQQSGGSSIGSSLGSIMSLIGGLGLFSDERAKTNIDRVGEDPETGDPIYAYDYKSDVKRAKETGEPMPPKRLGPMAQDVAARNPDEAIDLGGLLGIKMDRQERADGGASQQKMVPIYTYTGEAAPETGITDLSSVAYQTNPNFPPPSSSSAGGLGDLFTPYEEYQKIGQRWVSPGVRLEEEELEPFEVKHHKREERADGGMLPDQSDFLEMSKKPPYGLLSNPKVASAILPVQDIPTHKPQTPDLGYVPGLPGAAKGSSGGGGGGGGGAPSMPKLGGKGKSEASASIGGGEAKSDTAKGEATKEPGFFDKLTSGVSDIFSGGTAAPSAPEVAAPVDAGNGDFLGGIGKMFGGLFADGGRVEKADGGGLAAFGNITGSQLGPITNPYGTGQINGLPAGVGAFNTPINTGINVQQAFGPGGLGRQIPQSLANFRMPWTAVNTGSPEYNNLLLRASQNIGPRQLTPQEFGLPSIASASANYAGTPPAKVPTQAQIDATADEVEKANLQNQLDLANLKNKYPNLTATPSNYIYQMTDMLTPQGLKFMVPVSGYSSPSFYVNPFSKSQPQYKADGGAVRDGYAQGGRKGLWGKFQDTEEGARAAALAIKEDVMHPQEVLHSIWNRVKAGTYGETPSQVMAARRQYEPMNPSNRGTSRDPRTMSPNDPKVRELADYWSKIKANEVEDPTHGATHFMNPDIVSQRRHGRFKPWERQGLNDPSSVRVGQQIFYNPSRTAVASDRPKGDYFSNLKPAQPYGPGDPSVLAGGYGKFGKPIPSTTPPLQDSFGKGLDLSGGPMAMKDMKDQYPVEPMPGVGLAGRNIGPGDMDLTIGQAAGLPALADPGTPGTTSPPLNVAGTDVQTPMGNAKPMGFGDVPPSIPEPTSEMDKVTEIKDGRHPMVKTTAVGQPAPGHKVIAEKSAGFGPVKGVAAKDAGESDNPFEGLLNDLFGGKDAGYLQGPDIGDLGDLLGFSHGGAVRHGYEGGGRAKEAWDILTGEYGATPAEASVLVPAAAAESAFDPTAVHDQGTGYGLFGHRLERADALRKALADKASDFKEQLGFGLKEFRGRPEHRYVEGENPSLEDIMQAHGAYERPAGYKSGHPEGMLGYGKRRALTEAALKGDFGAFGNYKGSAGGDHVVATDRGDEGGDTDGFGGLRKMLGGDNDGQGGLFGMKPLMNRDLAMYLMATGAGMAASRNRSPLGAFGEGSLQGIEALQASQSMRANEEMKKLQAANIMSEMQKRNFELEELMRKARARRELLGGSPAGGKPAAADETAPPTAAMPTAPEAPKIVEEAPTAVSPTIPVEGEKTAATKPVADQYDTEISRIEQEIQANRQKAKQAAELGIPEDAKQFEDRADKAMERREKIVEAKRKSLTEKVGEGSPMDLYNQGQASAAAAGDMQQNLTEIESIIKNPKVDFGIAAPYLNAIKSGTAEAEQYFPGLKKILPQVDTEALGQAERLGAEGNKLILAATGGKLGAGISNADISFLKDTTFNVSRTREYNMGVLQKQQALQQKLMAQAEEQERYRAAHGGLDANFQAHMAKWGQAHPVQSYMRKEAEHKAGQIGKEEKTVSKDRTIVRRGKSNGRPVVEYSDGTVDYAD
jgi:hypothetical protein